MYVLFFCILKKYKCLIVTCHDTGAHSTLDPVRAHAQILLLNEITPIHTYICVCVWVSDKKNGCICQRSVLTVCAIYIRGYGPPAGGISVLLHTSITGKNIYIFDGNSKFKSRHHHHWRVIMKNVTYHPVIINYNLCTTHTHTHREIERERETGVKKCNV